VFCTTCKNDVCLWTGEGLCEECKKPKGDNEMGSFNNYDDYLKAFNEREAKLESASSFKNLSAEEFNNLSQEDKQEYLDLKRLLGSPESPLKAAYSDVNAINGKSKEEAEKAAEEAKMKAIQQTTDTEKVMQQFIKEQDKKMLEDLINNPNHYHFGGLDVYELMQMKFSPEYYRGFCLGNILKYVLRHELKGGVSDLEKADFNLKRLVENYKGVKYVPDHKKGNK
jgi:hypothetical protein